MANLKNFLPAINLKVKECLLQNAFTSFALHEHSKREKTVMDKSDDDDILCDRHDYVNLTRSLAKCLKKYVSIRSDEIFHCFAFKENYPMFDLHAMPHNLIVKNSKNILRCLFTNWTGVK